MPFVSNGVILNVARSKPIVTLALFNVETREPVMPIKIGELAKRTGFTVETIRYYEKEGLLPEPARSHGNYRLYGDEHIERLRFIRHCRTLDMALSEVRILLQYRDTPYEDRSEEHTSELQSRGHLVCRLLLEKKKIQKQEGNSK